MSYLLACTSSDLFKAVAPVAGVMMKETLDNCNPQNPIPVFEIHGTNDKISLFQGDIENKGGWGSYYGLPETIQFWADKHNLDKNENIYIASKGEGDQNDIIFERYWSEDNINEVWLYKIVDAGHIWPVFTSFRGGKGVATAFGVFVALFPPVALLVLFCSFLLLAAFRYVSLMSMVGTITGAGYVALVALLNGPDVASVAGDPYHDSYILLAGVLFLLIEYKHFPNLLRLISGTEPKVGQGGSLRPQN